MIGTQREDDIVLMEVENEFLKELKEFMDYYLGERGERWQEENETIPLEQATPQPPLPNNLA